VDRMSLGIGERQRPTRCAIDQLHANLSRAGGRSGRLRVIRDHVAGPQSLHQIVVDRRQIEGRFGFIEASAGRFGNLLQCRVGALPSSSTFSPYVQIATGSSSVTCLSNSRAASETASPMDSFSVS